jgi:quercetin dioxygenase-like cupin family protein
MTTRSLTREAAPSLWVVRDRLTFHGPIEGSDLSLVEVEIPPGSGTPPHTHASPETFHVLSGEVTFTVFDGPAPRQVTGTPGATVAIASRVPHNYANASGRPATMLVMLDDSMVACFQDLGRREAPPMGPPSEAEIGAVMDACRRHGIEVMAGAPA